MIKTGIKTHQFKIRRCPGDTNMNHHAYTEELLIEIYEYFGYELLERIDRKGKFKDTNYMRIKNSTYVFVRKPLLQRIKNWITRWRRYEAV
jgi:hypothetical protein